MKKKVIREGEVLNALMDEVERKEFSLRRYKGLSAFYGIGEDVSSPEKSFTDLLRPYVEDIIDEDYTMCVECRGLFYKDGVVEVNNRNYCKNCKPPYDRVEKHVGEDGKLGLKYYKNDVECDEKGKIIKSK